MNNEKWSHYLSLAEMPDSMTSLDIRRRAEALYYITFATDGWDKTKQLLVLGCGDGYEVSLLKEAGWKNVKGITFYDNEYKMSQDVGLKEVEKGDIHDMPYQDDAFDYVISKETMEHMISPFIALCEINRVMKKGAKFVHYIPEGESKQSDWYHYMCAPSWLWKDLMKKTGFVLDEVVNQIDQIKYIGHKDKRYDYQSPRP